MPTKLCPKCHGQRTILCLACHGTGKKIPVGNCKECGGTGRRICDVCSCTGKADREPATFKDPLPLPTRLQSDFEAPDGVVITHLADVPRCVEAEADYAKVSFPKIISARRHDAIRTRAV